MRKGVIIILGLFFLFSCRNEFPDFIQKEPGIYMKLLSFDEKKITPTANKYGAVSIEIYAENELLFRHDKVDRIDLKTDSFNFLTKHLNIGDSCHFIVPKDRIESIFRPLEINKNKFKQLSVFMKLDGVYPNTFDEELIEQHLLKLYLKTTGATSKKGIYEKIVKHGIGKEITLGDEVTINLRGCFINKLTFDDALAEKPFTFTYGEQEQIIKGLEIAIKGMRKGQKSKIIIPSQLAFGARGSTTSIVPPYTTVIYDLEIVNVN